MEGSILENMDKCGKTAVFTRWLRPDWGNTAPAAMAGLGSIGLIYTGPQMEI